MRMEPLTLNSQNQTNNNPVILLSSPIKIGDRGSRVMIGQIQGYNFKDDIILEEIL